MARQLADVTLHGVVWPEVPIVQVELVDASAQIDAYLDGLPSWQRGMLTRLRELIHEADPGMGEAWKWDTPVFVHGSNICAIGAFADHVKVNFFKGGALSDPGGLFNAGLEAKTSRAIDLREGDRLDDEAFRALVREAVSAAG
ncbi:MAG: DUF1801 domain-containing protein [Candidatus Limnocylindria bacterium]